MDRERPDVATLEDEAEGSGQEVREWPWMGLNVAASQGGHSYHVIPYLRYQT